MTVVAFDTTSEHGSIALLRDTQVIEERALHSTDGFSPILFGELELLLARHTVSLADVDAFAAASGPGSFTGVRVGLTAAKGLAEALGRPVFGVSNLQALAAFGTSGVRAPWLDARRGEVYGALYDAELQLLGEEIVAKFEVWSAGLPAGAELISRPGVALAAAVGTIASGRWQAGERPVPESIDANYVRRSDAELFWKDLK